MKSVVAYLGELILLLLTAGIIISGVVWMFSVL